MAEKNFAITPSVSISRSKFLRTSQHKTSFNLGQIIPIYLDEVLPGDTRSMDIASLVRMSTPIAPIMDDIELEFFAFFVPNRIVWKNWKRFMGEAASAGYDLNAPVMPNRAVTPGTLTGSKIGNYMGIPKPVNQALIVSVLPLRGYAAIYNRWFRDENVEAPIVIDDGDGLDVTTALDYNDDPLVAYKKSDYFTRALPYAQKGTPVKLPLGLVAPITTGPMYSFGASGTGAGGKLPSPYAVDSFRLDGGLGTASLQYSGALHLQGTTDPDTTQKVVYGGTSSGTNGTAEITGSNLWVDLTAATAATINQIREAFQLQKLLEKDALYGTRYWEILYGHFGVRSPDATLQDPEYLGGHKCMINVDQVLQTSETSTTSLGTPGANSVTGTKASLFTKSFVEHGYIHIFAVARQRQHTYSQGLNRMFTRFDRYDYYWPEFANLGAQEIKLKELWADGSVGPSDLEDVFGYQECWAEYRYKPSIISGQLSPAITASLDYWTLADVYSSKPTLGTTFLKESRANIARALTTGVSGPDFIADFYFRDTAVRAMPLYSIPGLVDHH